MMKADRTAVHLALVALASRNRAIYTAVIKIQNANSPLELSPEMTSTLLKIRRRLWRRLFEATVARTPLKSKHVFEGICSYQYFVFDILKNPSLAGPLLANPTISKCDFAAILDCGANYAAESLCRPVSGFSSSARIKTTKKILLHYELLSGISQL